MKPSANADWLHNQYEVVQPFVTDRNRSYYQPWICSTSGTTNRMVGQSVASPVARLVSPWLMVRPCTTGRTSWKTCLRPLAILNRASWVLNSHDHRPCCDQICAYDHPRLLRSIARFVGDLSAIHLIFLSYISRNMVASPVWLGL